MEPKKITDWYQYTYKGRPARFRRVGFMMEIVIQGELYDYRYDMQIESFPAPSRVIPYGYFIDRSRMSNPNPSCEDLMTALETYSYVSGKHYFEYRMSVPIFGWHTKTTDVT